MIIKQLVRKSQRLTTMLGDALRWLRTRLLFTILIIGFIQGLFYLISIPPWWHNDEPGHFEYAWMVANKPNWPNFGEYDNAMRRQMARSMIANGYYDILNFTPNIQNDEPIDIGVSQVGDLPLYYSVASLPLRFLKDASFDTQNRAIRLVSLSFFLLTIYISWKIAEETFPLNHPLRWMVPLFLALLPGFADVMTSISNDVGAVLAYSLFLLFSVKLINRGPKGRLLLGLLASALLCYWTSRTSQLAILLLPVVIILSIFRARWRLVPILFLSVTILGIAIASLDWGDAALWYRITTQAANTRQKDADTPFSEYAFLFLSNKDAKGEIGQLLTAEQLHPLRNANVTLGSWIWASEPTEVDMPFLALNANGERVNSEQKRVTVTTEPTFFSFSTLIPSGTERGLVIISPNSKNTNSEPNAIYYDGLVMVAGEHTENPPIFLDPGGDQVIWDNQQYENIIRNGSAEQGWLRASPLVQSKMDPPLNFKPSLTLAFLQDLHGSKWYFRAAFRMLFQTFWGRFARAQAPLLGNNYSILEIASLLSVIGIAIMLIRRNIKIPWNILLLFFFAAAISWGAAVLRGINEIITLRPTIPWARYAFPAIIPTAALLISGWREVFHLIQRFAKLSPLYTKIVFIAFLLGLDIFALLSIMSYFHWEHGEEFIIILALVQVSMFFLVYTIHNFRKAVKTRA